MSEAPPREPLTRAAIVAAARRRIVDGGLAALSLRGVAGDLGVTAPALYAHVADKHDLLRAVAIGEFEQLVADFEAVDATDPLERTRAYGRAYLARAVGSPELFRTTFLFPPQALFPELAQGGPDVASPDIASRAVLLPIEAIRAAVAAGQLPPDTDPELAGMAMWAATHGLADVLLLGVALDEAMAERLVDTVIETMLLGLAAGGAAS